MILRQNSLIGLHIDVHSIHTRKRTGLDVYTLVVIRFNIIVPCEFCPLFPFSHHPDFK